MNAWDQILTRIEAKVNRHSFHTWFKPTSFLGDAGGAISVRVPSPMFTNWLTKHYSVVISEALAEVDRSETAIIYIPDDEKPGTPDIPPPAIPPPPVVVEQVE